MKLKATVSYREAAPKSATILILTPKILKGWWSKDAEGKEKLERAKLEDTVYFHVQTENLDDGKKISLKLWEQDSIIVDFLEPDDEKFSKKEVIKTAEVKNNSATVELLLEKRWEEMLKEDYGWLELYWEVSYKSIAKKLKEEDEYNILKVTYSDRNLYIKTPSPIQNLPEFISYEGDPMLLVELVTDFAGDQAVEKLSEVAAKKIAFARLPKSALSDSQGNPYKGQRLLDEYKEKYYNTEQWLENMENRNTLKDNPSNKDLNQHNHVSKNNNRLTVWRMVKHLSRGLDIFRLVNTVSGDDDSLPLYFGPFDVVTGISYMMLKTEFDERNVHFEKSIQEEVDLAKLKGLDVTRKVINQYNHNEEFRWELLVVSKETANKLLQGEFKTFEELYEFNTHSSTESGKIQILYKEIFDDEKEDYMYIIETIFINE